MIELYNPLCICTIIVAPEHRNKGIGTTILQELIADPSKYVPFPTKEISAVIDNENFASIQTFQKAGFSIRNAIDDTCKAYVLKL
ncbi:MAG: GNAT family N-acetyltransferase [Clostridia bacterium]|nr:GNAT family N-acetyltransferase [Clostridia bacterium]